MITATDTTPAPLDPERAFLGCLLALPLSEARRLLAGMRPEDCGHPAAAHALALIIATVAAGHRPEPVTVFTHAHTTGAVTGEHAQHRLAHWLIDTHRDAPAGPAAGYLKTVVLDHAYRRAITEHATRLQQAARDCATDTLRELVDDTTTPDNLWERYQAALTGEPPERDGRRLGVAA